MLEAGFHEFYREAIWRNDDKRAGNVLPISCPNFMLSGNSKKVFSTLRATFAKPSENNDKCQPSLAKAQKNCILSETNSLL